MKHKKRKISVVEIIGIILVVAGLSLVAYDFAKDYFERQSIANEMKDFMSAAALVDEDDLNAKEANAADIWGTIEIEKLNVQHPIVVSSDWNYLSRYVVAWEDAPKPPNQGNFSIAGHNGRCASCVFRNFDTLNNGDVVRLRDKDNIYTYEIYNINKVPYTDTSVLNDTPGKTTLTLVTCSEQNTYDEWRIIVKAELVDTKPLKA